jgi:hypothetical protein
MGYIKLTPHLVRSDQAELIRQAQQTHRGMAHFAGTGPVGRTCRECAHWQSKRRWSAPGALGGGEPLASPCARYHVLMRQPGKPVPHSAWACRHFEQSPAPQPLQRPRKEFER